MGFLDDAINKTKEAFDVVCQKTDEVVTVEKQKFNISSLKSKCEKDYCALGKIYFELVKDQDDMLDGVRVLVESIKEKNEEIDRLNKEVQNAKNKRVCPSCNANIEKNSVYCNNCGQKLTLEDE